MPLSSTIFERELEPAIIVMSRLAIPKVPARNSRSASLAAPSTGGAVRRIRNASPWTPQISLADARGCTRIETRTPVAVGTIRSIPRHRRFNTAPWMMTSRMYATSGVMSTGPMVGMIRRSGPSIHSLRTNDQRIHFDHGEI